MTPEDDDSAPAGSVLFAILFAVFSLWLLLQIGSETKFSARGKLFAQPRFWPAVSVGGMLLFGVLHLATSWHAHKGGTLRTSLLESVAWLRALEYLVWFMVYVFTVPKIGYLLATVIFTFLLCVRCGYRKPKHMALAIAMGIGVVLVFKTGLSVKIPGGEIYEYLPESIRNFMIVNF